MKLSMSLGALGIAAVVALAGCSSDGESDSASTPDTASPPAATAPGTPQTDAGSASVDDTACRVAEISGESNNPELQAAANEVFASLDCAAAESLGDQLKAAAAEPSLTQQAEDAGWELTVGEAAGGVSMSLVDVSAMTTCMVTVIDTPKGKTLNCGNV